MANFPILTGVNIAGGEWEWNSSIIPKEGTNYQWISQQDCDYLSAKGFNFGRLLFSWELLQPTLNGELTFVSGYGATMKARVDYMTNVKGMYVMIEPHGASSPNFARYKGNAVGSAAVPNSAFADLWKRIALVFKDNPRVVFGLSNEPNNIGTMQWYSAAQAAIDAIRATGAANIIMVPGNGWTQPSTWNDTWYDTSSTKTSNATGWATINDPLKNTVVTVHTYFDADGGGSGTDITSSDIIVQRLQPVINWARSKGLKVHLSEFGASIGTTGAQTAVDTTCNYIKSNSDVLMGWSWWAYGPPSWWGGYKFTLCPTNNYATDDPKISWLKPYMAPLQNPADFTVSSTTPSPTPTTSSLNVSLTSTTLKAPGDASTKYFSKYVGSGQPVPSATYTIKATARTTYSDQYGFSVAVILQNDHSNVDLSWDDIRIDLRGHSIQSIWGAVNGGVDSNGYLVIKSGSDKTIKALNKNSFGFFVKRNPAYPTYQVIAKSMTW